MNALERAVAQIRREKMVHAILTLIIAVVGALRLAPAPLLVFFDALLFALPGLLALGVVRYGSLHGILIALASSVAVRLVAGGDGLAQALMILMVFGLTGIALGEAIRERFAAVWTLALGSGVFLFAIALSYALGRALFQTDIFQMISADFQRMTVEMSSVWQASGMDSEAVAQAQAGMQHMFRTLQTTWPSLLPWAAVTLTYLNYFGVARWLRRAGTAVEWFPPFRLWRFPWYLSWGYILGHGSLLLSQYLSMAALDALGANLLIVFANLFMLQGLAVLWYYLDKIQIPWLLRALAVFVIVESPLLVLVVWTGLLDAWFDFRKLSRDALRA